MRKKRNRKQRTGRFCNISSFFMAPYFIIFFAAPQCAPRRELVSPSVTLAPHGEFAFVISPDPQAGLVFLNFRSSSRLVAPLPFSAIFRLLTMWPPSKSWKRSKADFRVQCRVHNRCQSMPGPCCRSSCSGSCRCLRLCRSLTYLSHLVRITKIAAVFALRLVITLAALWSRLTILGYSAPGTLRSALLRRKRP